MEEGKRKREGKTRNEERVEGKGSNMKRGDSCAKTKTEMGLVTATVGAAGLALSLGPLYSHPQEAGPLWRGRKGVASELGLEEGGPASPVTVGLVTAGTQRTRPASLARSAHGAGVGWRGSLLPHDTASQH